MKTFTALTLSASALSLSAGLVARRRSRKAGARLRYWDYEAEEIFARRSRALTRGAIQYFIVPLRTASGVADWFCHRAARIEENAGARESLLHPLMLVEAGIPVTAGLLLEIDPLVLSTMISAFFLHEATAMWDVSYAVQEREVTALEQHVHSFLEMVPLMATLLASLLHWNQLKALVGLRVEPHRPLAFKRAPLDRAYVGGALATMFLIEFLSLRR